jgi:hypothetical protein
VSKGMSGQRTLRYLVGVLAVVLLCGTATAAPEAAKAKQGQGRVGLRVTGSLSGSTLTVNLRGKGGAKCSEWLVRGEDRTRIPGLYLGAQGLGQVEWDIPSSTHTGSNKLEASCGHSGVRSVAHTMIDIPQSAVSGPFTTVLNVLLYVFLASSLALFFYYLVRLVVQAPNSEVFPRALALIGGAVVALLSEVAGTGIAEQLVDSLAGSGPVGGGVKLLSVVIPGGAAVAFGWYFAHAMERSSYRALRWMVLLGSLTVVTFAVILAEATQTEGVFLGAAAIPNASFVLGLIISVLAFGGAEDDLDRQGGLLSGIFARIGKSRSPNPFAED